MLDVESFWYVGVTFAYLFARFPSLTQTFCFREVEEMSRQMGAMPIWSLRYPNDLSEDCPVELAARTRYLPDRDELKQMFRSTRTMIGHFPLSIVWQVKRWGDKKGKYRLYEAAWLGRELKAQGVTHIHTHFAGIGARTAWWINKLYGISYSFTGHANDMFCANDDPITLDDLVASAKFVITVSNFSRDWLCKFLPKYQDKIFRIYNGIPLSPVRNALEIERVPLLLSVGRLIEKKGFADLIKACASLRTKKLKFQCQIIGTGPLEQSLREQVSLLGLEDFIFFSGALSFEEVRRCLRQASVFVLPCITEANGGMDNLPTVILEAMEMNLPVVSTALAAIPEMVCDGETGFLVQERNPDRLAEKLADLLSSSQLRMTMGAAGRSLVEKQFSVQITVQQLCERVNNVAEF